MGYVRLMGKLLIAALAVCVSAPASAETINLVCNGSGSATSMGTATVYNPQAQQMGSIQSYGRQGFADSVVIEIDGGAGRIQVPDDMTPGLSSGEQDGWRPLSKIKITDRAITAQFGFNFMNKPRIQIDRNTGRIRIKGKSNFSGWCETFTPGRKF